MSKKKKKGTTERPSWPTSVTDIIQARSLRLTLPLVLVCGETRCYRTGGGGDHILLYLMFQRGRTWQQLQIFQFEELIRVLETTFKLLRYFVEILFEPPHGPAPERRTLAENTESQQKCWFNVGRE